MFVGVGQSCVRRGEFGQALRGDFEVNDRRFEICGFQQTRPYLVMSPGGVWLQFNGFVQVLYGCGVFRLSR